MASTWTAVAVAAGTSPTQVAHVAVGPATIGRAEAEPSAEARQVLDWIAQSGDNLDLPFVVIDKVHARVFAFGADGALRGSAPALMGLGRGDQSVEGIGQRRLADIKPSERTTPAGRFVASIGNDLGEADILWIDYENSISLHRVIAGKPKERRLKRLASPSADDNRISYGCINVPVKFFESVILPLFNKTNGIVYILPEAMPPNEIFDLPPPLAAKPEASKPVKTMSE